MAPEYGRKTMALFPDGWREAMRIYGEAPIAVKKIVEFGEYDTKSTRFIPHDDMEIPEFSDYPF